MPRMTITALTLVLLLSGQTPGGAQTNGVRGLSSAQTTNYNGYYTAYSPAGYAYATNPGYAATAGYAGSQYPAQQYSAGYAPVATGAKTAATTSRHPANVGYHSYRPAYLVSRPTSRAAQTVNYAPQATANYGYAPQAANYAPQSSANYGYAPQTANYAPQTSNYAPQAAYYAPSPTGAAPGLTLGATGNATSTAAQATYYAPQSQAQSFATVQPTAAYSGGYTGSYTAGFAPQATAVATPAYVQTFRPVAAPPTFAYRTTTGRVPVTYYRPVVVYDPVTSAPVTCQMATCGTECQTQRRGCGWFSWLFGRNRSCGSAPTTSYCGTAACGTTTCGTATCAQTGCGAQPYYPATQAPTTIIQQPATVIQQPGTIIQTQPSRVIPATPGGSFVPLPFGSGSTVPSPPTRFPGTVSPSTIPSTGVPASERPRLAPGTTFPAPSGYPPVTDPYSGSTSSNSGTQSGGSTSSSTGASSGTGGSTGSNNGASSSQKPDSDASSPSTKSSNGASGTGYPATGSSLRLESSTGPQLGAPHSSIQAVPDPDYNSRPRMPTRAPQLIDPRDKTAQADSTRWAVVPAVWAKPRSNSSDVTPVSLRELPIAESPYIHRTPPAPVIDDSQWDDSGWKAAR